MEEFAVDCHMHLQLHIVMYMYMYTQLLVRGGGGGGGGLALPVAVHILFSIISTVPTYNNPSIQQSTHIQLLLCAHEVTLFY